MCTISSKTGTIDLRYYKQAICLAMNLNIKEKRNRIEDFYSKTSVGSIWNDIFSNISVTVIINIFVKVSNTKKWFTLVGLY